ncbi:hypothetical protein ACGFZB_11170 [Streptomyces cinerochromogenes]|uniref:Uncharacterized protein n=1 Tax=Streptomyces cinerochromogenes TaxID=66422 RepID=A0ABW7B1H1_9ACTN
MSDDWKKQPEYKSDVQQVDKTVDTQVKPITTAQDVLAHMPLFGGFRVNLVGSTNFEEHRLNDMIELVEDSNPEDLELTSKALFDAGKAIRKAAKDLEQHLDVDWEGDAAEQFHIWTKGLINYTHDLAGYADQAGTHISVAATGLASARVSMPPKDTRPAGEQKKPDELPKTKQVDGDPDYAAALKVEKNRQEAINQMNRLASYYKVAATDLSKQQEPKPLEPISNVGVPAPPGLVDDQRQRYGSGSSSAGTAAVRGDLGEGHSGTVTSNGTGATGHTPAPPLKEVHEPSVPSGHEVGTEINTTTTLPPQTPTVPTNSPAPTVPTTGGGQTLPLPPGPMGPPVTPTTGRVPGYGPTGRFPVTAQGRTGPSGTGGSRVPQGPAGQPGRTVSGGRVPQGPTGQAGRSVPGARVPQGPVGQQPARAMGRANPAGQPGVRGGGQPGRSPMGRPVTGGTQGMPNATGGRAGTTGPARNGVVGGKPVTGRTPGGAANPRVPRGTVVGAEEPVSSTPSKGSVGQRGVVGAPTAKAEPGAGQAVLRSASNPEGVIGAPREPAKGSGSSGSGLGRGAVGGRQGPSGGADRTGGTAEKEQRHPSQQRRDAPQKSD